MINLKFSSTFPGNAGSSQLVQDKIIQTAINLEMQLPCRQDIKSQRQG